MRLKTIYTQFTPCHQPRLNSILSGSPLMTELWGANLTHTSNTKVATESSMEPRAVRAVASVMLEQPTTHKITGKSSTKWNPSLTWTGMMGSSLMLLLKMPGLSNSTSQITHGDSHSLHGPLCTKSQEGCNRQPFISHSQASNQASLDSAPGGSNSLCGKDWTCQKLSRWHTHIRCSTESPISS